MYWLVRSRSIIGAVALAMSVQGATAATVTDIQGQVQISQAGGPFRAVTGSAVCGAGDVVRSGQNSGAQVVNPNGVIQTVSPGNPVACVAEPGPAGAPAATNSAFVGGAVALGAGVAVIAAVSRKKSSASP